MVDENVAGATLTAVTTENATSVTVDRDEFEVADGNLKLKDDMSLDFEGDDGGSIAVTITASGDGESATHTVTVTINDVNEMPTIDVRDGEVVPQKDVTSSLTIDESVMGSDLPPLALIEVMDADAADATTGQDGADMVMISGDMADYFEVKLDPENGLWLALKADSSLDYEATGGSVMLTVTYTDSAGQMASADVTVMINNVNEAAEVNGDVADMTFVGGEESSMDVDLKALFTDPDGDTLTYRLSDNAPDWLEMSVTTRGSGDAQTVTATISGTPAAGTEGDVADVSIVATDGDGVEAHAMFDLIIDAENDAPTRLELRVTDEDGLVIRTAEANVDENAMGVELGSIYLRDPDDNRHPHGQHEYSFSDDRFEVVGGMLKLKDDASLDREADGSRITLTVTATDMAEGDAAQSISLDITITIGNVDTGTSEGPRAVGEIEAVTITVDEDLREDDPGADEGRWLNKTPGKLSAAFEDPDGDKLTYSLGSGAPRWLQINEDTGKLTNAEGMIPRRGVYDVTVVASDDDGNTASASFVIAVALSDPNDEDNDEPDISNIDEIGYTEGDESGAVVATFEIRDDDIEIAPHEWGVHEVTFTAHQDPGDGTPREDWPEVTNAFKIVRVGDDGNSTADYEIRAKTPAELAMGADGPDMDKDPDVYPANHAMAGQVIPVPAIDYEAGDEIDFEIEVTDMAKGSGQGMDDRSLSIDIEDAPDESPVFQRGAVDGGTATRGAMNSTTISVNQQLTEREVLVIRLDELWDDADTDDDDLEIEVRGTGDLPDWIKVYGPDRWEDIYENRRTGLTDEEVNAVTGVRDRDEVVVIVMDRTAGRDGEDVSLTGGSFTISADDRAGRDDSKVTETIMISVSNTNVSPPDPTKVVSISGGDPNKDKEVTGTGNLTMNVNFNLDPDLASGETPYLVLYTWSVTTDVADDTDATNGDETVDIISVSSTPQPLMLGVPGATPGTVIRNAAYVDQTITAKVEIFEVDGATGKVTMAQEYMATVAVASAADAPVTPPTPTTVSFGDITTDTSGVVVTITATGEAAEAGTARLQSSTNGTSGWINVDSAAADTSGAGGTVTVTLDVDANGDGATTGGDGGGLYYRVQYMFEDEDDDPGYGYSDVIKLGDVSTDPADIALQAPAAPASGDTIRVNNLTANVTVQWQAGMDTDTSGTIEADEWMDLAGETGLTLTLTDDHAGKTVRAMLTHMGDEDNPSHVTWVDYSATATVAALPTAANNTPVRNQETYWIEVNLNSDNDDGRGSGSVAGMFFDSDGDDLTYSLVGTSVDDAPAGGIQDGNTVFRTSQAEAAEAGNAGDIILTVNGGTGEITFYTNRALSHDNDATDTDTDGAGNWFTATVQASDGKPDPVGTVPDTDPLADDTTDDDLTINVRVNVAPNAINVGGSPIEDDATETPTASGISFAETAEYDGTDTAAIDVQDLNFAGNATDDAHSYGTHTVTVMSKKANGTFVNDDRFELERTAGDDMSLWTLTIKDDAEFDYEHADNPMGVITLKVTATDGGGKSKVGYISVTLTDVDDGDTTNGTGNEDVTDPQYEAPSGTGAGNGGVMTTGGDAGDDDGGGNAPGDGGIWVESDFMEVDLFESYMLIIDDIDIA